MTSSLGRRRRDRRLTEDERRLWEKVADTIDDLKPEVRARLAAESIAPPPLPTVREEVEAQPLPLREPRIVRPTGPTRQPTGRLPVIHVKHADRLDGLAPAIPAPASLTRFDQRTKRRLVRGTIPIDDRLDLHGCTEAAAHSLLRGFLRTSRARGARVVLVITGKGQGPGKARGLGPHERGVLRRAVPHWLSDPDLRDIVLGFEEAHLAHGGAGAIYVRLRRPRGAAAHHVWDDDDR